MQLQLLEITVHVSEKIQSTLFLSSSLCFYYYYPLRHTAHRVMPFGRRVCVSTYVWPKMPVWYLCGRDYALRSRCKHKLMHIKSDHTRGDFVAGCTATLLFVRVAHEISNAIYTFYKLLENRQPVYFQATCRMYHAIFPCAARTNINVAVSPATKVALVDRAWSA